jgi:hypothetical protein
MKPFTLIFLALLLTSCEQPLATPSDDLPTGATNIMDIGGGWHSFEYRGRCYAVRKTQFDRSMSYTTFEINCKESS